MRGNSLGAMVQMLRRELGLAESQALGRNVRNAHVQALAIAQDRLYSAHDWPFKKIWRDVPGMAGQRYYAPPANMVLESLRDATARISNLFRPCYRGILPQNYNMVNSDAGVRQDWVRRWDLYNDPTTNGDMLEFWPIPASDNFTIVRFYGIKTLAPLVMDSDKADLDDNAIVLTAAADLANPRYRAQAQQKAVAHIFSLARTINNSRTFVSGGGCDPCRETFRPPQIVIAQ